MKTMKSVKVLMLTAVAAVGFSTVSFAQDKPPVPAPQPQVQQQQQVQPPRVAPQPAPKKITNQSYHKYTKNHKKITKKAPQPPKAPKDQNNYGMYR